MYPELAEIDGKTYEINTDFRVGLQCFMAINDDEIDDFSRTLAVVGLLFKDYETIQDYDKALEVAKKYLTCEKKYQKENIKIDMDFIYDEAYIKASFLSDYRIDLNKIEYMHWYQFCELIAGLTDGSILNKVRDLRNIDLNEYKDRKQRAKIAEAKANVALPVKYSKEEQEEIDEFEALFTGSKNERKVE